MREFCLLGLEQAGVIVPLGTGVLFWTLLGQPGQRLQQEGVFVPVSNDPMVDFSDLAMVRRLSGLGEVGSALSIADVEEIDALLLEVSSSDHFQVDRNRLQESQSGWVLITIDAQGEFSYFSNTGRFSAILVWPVKS